MLASSVSMTNPAYNFMNATTMPSSQQQRGGFDLDMYFDSSPDLLCIAGYDGYFKRVNPTVSKTLGYSDEELFSRPIDSFVYWEDREMTSRGRESLKSKTPLLNFENRYQTKSGEIIWLSWTSMPMDDDKVIFAIAKNITHRRRQDEERNRLIADLTKVNHDLKQLTYTTSHDLRSPVSNLLSVFSLINTNKITDPETLELIKMLRDASQNLKSQLNTYVDALTVKNVLNVELEHIALESSLLAVMRSLKPLRQETGTMISYDFEAQPTVNFNKPYLESIFLNLITNSIKYKQPGQPPVITIRSVREAGVTRLIYTDQGLGFDMAKVKDRLFGFSQKFHGHADSKGIGLYLIYNHVTSLGGTITLDSSVNAGATFTITFRD